MENKWKIYNEVRVFRVYWRLDSCSATRFLILPSDDLMKSKMNKMSIFDSRFKKNK